LEAHIGGLSGSIGWASSAHWTTIPWGKKRTLGNPYSKGFITHKIWAGFFLGRNQFRRINYGGKVHERGLIPGKPPIPLDHFG